MLQLCSITVRALEWSEWLKTRGDSGSVQDIAPLLLESLGFRKLEEELTPFLFMDSSTSSGNSSTGFP